MEELIKIQSELKAPKNKYNSFGKYSYRSCEDILEAVKPLLKETKCTLVIYDDLAMMGDWHYIKSVAVLTNSEGKTAMGVGFAREDPAKSGMSMSQISGSSSSYARKYALNGLFLIDDTKDADTDEYQKESAAKAKKAVLKATPLEQAIAECNAATSKEALLQVWNNHPELNKDKDFLLAMSTKKKEFQG